MRRLIALVLLGAALCGCHTTSPSVTGTIRTPEVIYGNPGRK